MLQNINEKKSAKIFGQMRYRIANNGSDVEDDCKKFIQPCFLL